MLALSVGAAMAAASTPEDFSRYEVIVAKRPFGGPPAGAIGKPAPPPDIVPPEAAVKNLRLVGLTEDPLGLCAYIANVKSSKNYMWRVGDSEDGLTLTDANYDEAKVLIREGGRDYWLPMTGEVASAQSPGVAAVAPSAGVTAAVAAAARPFSERLRQRRRDSVRVITNEAPQLSGEELAKHLREYNLKLIRARARGEDLGPVLPIELTPEEDAALVSDGTLPPQE